MICRKCHKDIQEHSVFCSFCGTKQEIANRKCRANGEGSAYKRGRTYTAVYVEGYYTDESGVHAKKITKGGFATKKDALAYIPELKKARVQDAQITLKALYSRVMASHFEKVSASSVCNYEAAMEHLKPLWAYSFQSLTIDEIQTCFTKCAAGYATKCKMRSVLGILYKYAIPRGIVSTNLSQYIDIGNNDTETRPAFTKEQIEKIFSAEGRAADITKCLIYTGFRPGELLSLTRESYHKEGSNEWFVGGGKTEAGTNRIVPICEKIKPIIHNLVFKANPYIFSAENGKKLTDKTFRDHYFFPLLKELGIEGNYVPYSCRHTFSNLGKEANVPAKDLAAIMGHSDATMSMYYQSADMDALQRAASAI